MPTVFRHLLLSFLLIACTSEEMDKVKQGDFHFQREEYDKAIDCYSKAIHEDEKAHYHAQLYRGLSYERLNDTLSAILDYQSLVLDFPDSTFAMFQMVKLMYGMEGYDKLYRQLDHVIAMDPKRKEAFYLRALVQYEDENFTDALDDLNNAINLDPLVLVFYEWRCKVYYNMNFMTDSNLDFEKCVELGSDMTFVQSLDNTYIRGIVKDSDSNMELPLSILEIQIMIDGEWKDYLSLKTDSDGKYEGYLYMDYDYKVSYAHSAYFKKYLLIDLKNISEEDQYNGFELNVDMTLFKEDSNFDQSILEDPIGKAFYNPSSELLEWDLDYTREMQKRITSERSASLN